MLHAAAMLKATLMTATSQYAFLAIALYRTVQLESSEADMARANLMIQSHGIGSGEVRVRDSLFTDIAFDTNTRYFVGAVPLPMCPAAILTMWL